MKRLFAAVLSAVLILSLSACADPAENSSQTSSSSTAEQSSEPEVSGQPEEEKNEAAEDTGSGADSASREEVTAPDQPEKPASQAGPVSSPDTAPEPQPSEPAEQPSQPSTPAAPETDDTGWTQEKVDAVVEAYRSAALERGWTEDTSLNIELTTGGAWGNPFNTNWTDYNVLTDPANIEEYLYGREYARNAEPEDMYFHVVVEEYSDYWEIYFIFA